jgi:hypothetical protein
MTDNVYSTAVNASRSPLLLLPPEIRTRIYRYVFDVGVIHITHHRMGDRARNYALTVCHCPDLCEGGEAGLFVTSNRVGRDVSSGSQILVQPHQDCVGTGPNNTRKPLCQYLQLDLLQTCRQIYHEAVLEPFKVNRFHYTVSPATCILDVSKLKLFLEAMVPTQIRAIKRLRIVCVGVAFPCLTVTRQLRGLEHLDIQLVLSVEPFGEEFLTILSQFSNHHGIVDLAEVPLKSLRVTIEVQSARLLLIKLDTAAIDAWLKALEARLTGPTGNQVGTVSITGL